MKGKSFSRKASLVWLCVWLSPAAVFSRSVPEHQLMKALATACWGHPLGFDAFGRDALKTVLSASGTSVFFSLTAVVLSFAASLALGTALALSSGWIRAFSLRALELLLAFPSLLFALAWAAVRGPGWGTLMFALLIGTIPGLIRLTFARSQELLSQDFVLAARSLGATDSRILLKYLIPSVLSLFRVKAPNLFAHALVAEATLSFLGIGAPIGRDTWGSLLSQAKDYLLEAPHLAFGFGVPLVITVLALQLLSEYDLSVRQSG